jgi:uncharacterized membrane-anchored protein YhcB (DUF1043 family)
MAEEYASQTVAAAAEPTETAAEAGPGTAGHDAPAQPAADAHLESRTREMLRKAIQNVMGEIDYHEMEAQKHLQQAAELREELRDSLRFLQEQARKAQPSVVHEESPSARNFEPSVVRERPAAKRRRRSGQKKKSASRKTTKE